MAVTCYDCAFCASRDVFTGFCEKKFEKVVIDDPIECDAFEAKAKCKNCAHYAETEEFLGKCMDMAVCFPDLLGCKDYVRA